MSAKADTKKKEPKAAPVAAKEAPAAGAKGGRGAKKSSDAPASVEASKPQADGAAPRQQKQAGGGGPTGANRIPMPDKAERDAQVETIMADFNKLKAERDGVQKKIKELIESSKGGNEERQKVRQELAKIREELNRVRADKDAVLAQQKAAVASVEAKIAEERKAKEGLGKFTSAETIDEEIKRIEKIMTSSNFSAKEEKDMIRDMDKLRLSKKNIGAYKTKQDEVAKAKDAKKEVDVRFNEKKAIADEVNKRFQNIRDALAALDVKDKEGVGAAIPELRKKQEDLNTELDELLKKKAAVFEDFKQQMNTFHELLEERKRQDKERREAEQERRRTEQEEREKEQTERRQKAEEEEMKKKPWESEIALCDVLITYLERVSSKSGQAAQSAGAASASASSAPKRSGTDFGELKPLTRSEDDYIVLGKKTAKPAAAKEKPVKEKSTTLTHTLDILNSFSLLSLIPPSSETGIDESIKQLKDKRAYYDVLPRPAKKASATPARDAETAVSPVAEVESNEKSNAAEKRGSKKASGSNPPSVQDASSFPNLPGSKPTSEAGEKQKWGPKPTDETAEEQVEESAEYADDE